MIVTLIYFIFQTIHFSSLSRIISAELSLKNCLYWPNWPSYCCRGHTTLATGHVDFICKAKENNSCFGPVTTNLNKSSTLSTYWPYRHSSLHNLLLFIVIFGLLHFSLRKWNNVQFVCSKTTEDSLKVQPESFLNDVNNNNNNTVSQQHLCHQQNSMNIAFRLFDMFGLRRVSCVSVVLRCSPVVKVRRSPL